MTLHDSARLLTLLVLFAICGPGRPWAEEARGAEPTPDPQRELADTWDRVFRNKPYRPVQPSDSFVAYCVQRSLRQSSLAAGSEVLVLAMGDGANAIHLAQQGLDVTGMDISPVAIEAAAKAAAAAGTWGASAGTW